jgi:hypothetical protein
LCVFREIYGKHKLLSLFRWKVLDDGVDEWNVAGWGFFDRFFLEVINAAALDPEITLLPTLEDSDVRFLKPTLEYAWQ